MARLARQLPLPLAPPADPPAARPLAYADVLEDLEPAPRPWLTSRPGHDLLRLLFLAAVLGPVLLILARAW